MKLKKGQDRITFKEPVNDIHRVLVRLDNGCWWGIRRVDHADFKKMSRGEKALGTPTAFLFSETLRPADCSIRLIPAADKPYECKVEYFPAMKTL